MIKRFLSILIVISLLFIFTSCNNTTSRGGEVIGLINRTGKIAKFDSPYTAGYQNEDGSFSLYIFSAPVQYKAGYKKYAPIDNSLISSDLEGYVFENKANSIKVYFPQDLSGEFLLKRDKKSFSFRIKEAKPLTCKKIDYTNMYGDIVQAVLYEDANMDYVFYPVNTGIKMELVLKDATTSDKYQFEILSSEKKILSEVNDKYVVFKKGDAPKAVFYPSLTTDGMGNITSNKVECTKKLVVLKTTHESNYPIKIDSSFEMYENKMPDSTVNSKDEPNSYLSNYLYITNDATRGMTRHFVRLRINYFFRTDHKNINSASFNIKAFGGVTEADFANRDVKLREVETQWTSTKLAWDNQGEITYSINKEPPKIVDGYCSFDVTNFIQKCAFDTSNMRESFGMVLLDEKANTTPTVFASSDNTLYPIYIKIDMDEPPNDFNIKDNINDV